jgi:hypothetical protein
VNGSFQRTASQLVRKAFLFSKTLFTMSKQFGISYFIIRQRYPTDYGTNNEGVIFMSWLARFLFTHVPRSTQPDGRPLYGYKTSDDNSRR